MTAGDAAERISDALKSSEEGSAGLDEVNALLSLLAGQLPGGRVEFTPRMVRGLSYYTGPIWEVVAEGVPGSLAGGGRYDHLIAQLGGPDVPATGGSLGIERILLMLPPGEEGHTRLDVAVTVMDQRYAARSFAFAAAARSAGLRASVYLGASGKLGRQLKWASDQGARWSLIYGAAEDEAGTVTVRDMTTGEQAQVPAGELGCPPGPAGRGRLMLARRWISRTPSWAGATRTATASRPRIDGAHCRRRARGEAVHVPRRRPGRGRAVLGGERHARVVGPGWPACCRPARRQAGDGGRVGDQGGFAFHDEIELAGRDAQRAARVTGQVLALAGVLAGLEPPAAVGPQRADAGDVRASVWVDRGQPAGVPVRAPGARGLAQARRRAGPGSGPSRAAVSDTSRQGWLLP